MYAEEEEAEEEERNESPDPGEIDVLNQIDAFIKAAEDQITDDKDERDNSGNVASNCFSENVYNSCAIQSNNGCDNGSNICSNQENLSEYDDFSKKGNRIRTVISSPDYINYLRKDSDKKALIEQQKKDKRAERLRKALKNHEKMLKSIDKLKNQVQKDSNQS